MTPATLITANIDKLRAYSRKLAKHNHEDVFQEACVTLLSAKTYDPSKSVASWLYLHVRSAAARWLRQESKLVPTGDAHLHGAATEPDQPHVVDLAQLRERAGGLPDRQRDVFLAVANDNTLGEAGAALGISKQAAGVHMQRARQALGIAA